MCEVLFFAICHMYLEENVQKMFERQIIFTQFRIAGNLLWNFLAIDDVECVEPFWDINGDSISEVLVESFDTGANGPAHFFCLSGRTGDTVWAVWPTGGVSNSGGWGDQCVASVPDLNGDGIGDALLGTAWGGRTVFAISGCDGTTIWSYDTYNDSIASGWVYCVTHLPDVDGDLVPEVLAGTGRYCQTVFCFSGATGRILWRFYGQDAFGSVCKIPDVNGDGFADVIAGTWGNSQDRHVYCISGNSRGNQPILIWSFYAGGDIYCVRSFADINDNGVHDVLVSSWNNHVYCLEGSSGELIWSANIGAYGMRIETLDDLNHDSIPEVIVGSWNNAVIILDGRNGNQVWQTPVGNDVWTVNSIASVNGDSQSDVIAGSGDGNVYCLDGMSGSIIWSYATGGWVNSVRCINDVNGDCLQDVIAGNQFTASPGIVCCIEGDTLMVATKEDRECSSRSTAISELKIFSADGRRVSIPHQGVYFIIIQKGGWLERKKLLILQ